MTTATCSSTCEKETTMGLAFLTKTTLIFILHTEVKPKWIIDLNAKAKATNLLEENRKKSL